MSAVTKIFIILNVVFTLILSAGFVVFVNRVDDYKKLYEKEHSERTNSDLQNSSSNVVAMSVKANQAAADAQMVAERSAWNAKLAELSLKVSTMETDKSVAQNGLNAARTDLTSAQAANAAAQALVKQFSDQLTELQKQVADLDRKYGEADLNNVKYVKELAILNRDIRGYQEQIFMLQQQRAAALKKLQDSGIAFNPGDGGPRVTPLIRGVVQKVESVAGNTYATISVGSADKVEKNMDFKILDNNGKFIGTLKIDTVDSNSAFGKFEASESNTLQPAMIVTTQI